MMGAMTNTKHTVVFQPSGLRGKVAVKFLVNRPKDIEKFDKSMAICEMLREAQEREEPFYTDKETEDCFGSVSSRHN